MAISQNFPEVRPTLNLNFARSKTLDPRITFERASIGTYVDENGLIKTAAADEARFDHDPETGESLGLLIEESRTNLLTYSENLTSGEGWSNVSQSSMTATNVSEENPGGGSTTTQITGGGVNSWWAKTFTASVSTTYQISLWVKVADGGADFNVGIRFYAPGATSGAIIIGTGFNVTSSWRRVTGYVTSSANFSGSFTRYIVLKLDNTRSFYAWGIQVEAGSFPTSYIPTSGSTLTRQSDNAQITGTNFTDFYNQNEGTWLCNFDYKGNNTSGGSTLYSTALNQSNRNWLRINYTTGTPNTIRQTINSNIDDSQITISSNTLNKISQAYASGDQSVYINGSVVIESTRGISTNHTTLDIGNVVWSKGLNQTIITGTIKQLLYYPERLTNTQLQNLTK